MRQPRGIACLGPEPGAGFRSPAASGRSSFTATFRSSSRSKARHTWPAAPEAISSSRRYRAASDTPWPATAVTVIAAGACQPAVPGPPGKDETSRCSDHKRRLPNPRIVRWSRSAARPAVRTIMRLPPFLPVGGVDAEQDFDAVPGLLGYAGRGNARGQPERYGCAAQVVGAQGPSARSSVLPSDVPHAPDTTFVPCCLISYSQRALMWPISYPEAAVTGTRGTRMTRNKITLILGLGLGVIGITGASLAWSAAMVSHHRSRPPPPCATPPPASVPLLLLASQRPPRVRSPQMPAIARPSPPGGGTAGGPGTPRSRPTCGRSSLPTW